MFRNLYAIANLSIISVFILKFYFIYRSKYKNQPLVCALMNFTFASFLQLFFISYSTMF